MEADNGTPRRADDPRRMLMLFGLAGGAIVVIGLIVVLVMSSTGGIPGDTPGAAPGPNESLPPLAQACPPPTSEPPGTGENPSTPDGERTVDQASGISYRAYGDPWMPWTQTWNGGDLQVEYRTGQYFVTETYGDDAYPQEYLASILSGSVRASVNDGTQLDLECVSQQVVADVRLNYYPDSNEIETLRDEYIALGGLPAWVRVFRLSFSEPGLEATDELVGVALINVGKAEAAVLYVSIPGTHSEYDPIIDEVFESVRPT
ncbi:hypothetical protein [Stackebrandtia soli]|uniref:hypothetical protein n=1 Tax=Stackebrandtia soli TaxID=1892856 RepID=UPI0039ECD798